MNARERTANIERIWHERQPQLVTSFLKASHTNPMKDRADRLKAAAERDPRSAAENYRKATDYYIRSGHIEQGLAVCCLALNLIGRPLYTNRIYPFFRALWRGARRGAMEAEAQRAMVGPQRSPHDRETEIALDVLFTTAKILAMVEPTRAWELETEHFALAMARGDAFHQARAFALSAVTTATLGQRKKIAAEKHIERARALLPHVVDRDTTSIELLIHGAEALLPYQAAEWDTALKRCDEGRDIAHRRGTPFCFEAVTAELFSMATLFFMGRYREILRRHPVVLQQAGIRGDRYAQATVCTGLPNIRWLIEDEPETAKRMSTTATNDWEYAEHLKLQRDWQMVSDAHIALYEDDGCQALRICQNRMPPRLRLMVSVEAFFDLLHARAAVAAAVAHPRDTAAPPVDPGSARQEAWRKIASANKKKMAGLSGMTELLCAALALQEGRPTEAISRCKAAADDFQRREMKMFEAAAQVRLAELQSKPCDSALQAMEREGVKNTRRMCDLLAPGFKKRGS